jgi:hypothetical protein
MRKNTTRYDSRTAARTRPTDKGVIYNKAKQTIAEVKTLPFHIQRNVIERIKPYPLKPKIGPERAPPQKEREAAHQLRRLKLEIRRYEDEMDRLSQMPQTYHRQQVIENHRKTVKKFKEHFLPSYVEKVRLMKPTKVKTEQP